MGLFCKYDKIMPEKPVKIVSLSHYYTAVYNLAVFSKLKWTFGII